MFFSDAFVLCFSLCCFFISSCMAQRDTCKSKNTFPLIFSRTPHERDDEQVSWPLYTGVCSEWSFRTDSKTFDFRLRAWAVDMFPKFVSCCLDAKIYKCMIKLSLWCFFFLFTFGQCPVLVKQITTSLFKIIQKSFGFSFNLKVTLEGERKGFKISIQNRRKELKSGTETSKTSKTHPYLPKFL